MSIRRLFFFRYNEKWTLIRASLGAILNFQWMTSFAERSYTWPKWLPKMKALLTLILQCVHIKRNVFTLYQEEYFLYTMSLWVCYRNFKAFVQRYSWIDDIEGNWRADLNATKKCELNFCYVIRQKLNFFSGNLFSNGFDTFSF